MSSGVVATLNRYRDLLLNTSKRNKELYYRPSAIGLTLGALNLTSENLDDVFRATSNLRMLLSPDQLKGDWLKKAQKLRNEDDAFQKEFGVSGAWLLGPFLTWRLPDEPGILVSPIFKSAIDLSKKRETFDIIPETDLVQLNPSLALLLKKNLGCDFSQIPTDSIRSALAYFMDQITKSHRKIEIFSTLPSILRIPPVTKTVEDEEGVRTRVNVDPKEYLSTDEYELLSKSTNLEFFIQPLFAMDVLESSKLPLYEDYEGIMAAETRPSVESFLNVEEKAPLRWNDAAAVDKEPERKNRFVVNIDASQHLAVLNATQSDGLVIQGPPGTGKSQTITNLISQLLSDGKKVLFVAEKRVALDVVHSRLGRAKLGGETIVLHTDSSNRKALYQSFVDSFDAKPNIESITKLNQVADLLDADKRRIQGYKGAVSAQSDQTKLSFEQLVGLAAARGTSKNLAEGHAHLENLDRSALEKLVNIVGDLQSIIHLRPDLLRSPWISKRTDVTYSKTLKAELTNDVTFVGSEQARSTVLAQQAIEYRQKPLAVRIVTFVIALRIGREQKRIKANVDAVRKKWEALCCSTLERDGNALAWLETLLACFEDIIQVSRVQEITESIDQQSGRAGFGKFVLSALSGEDDWYPLLEGQWAAFWIEALSSTQKDLNGFEAGMFEVVLRRLNDQFEMHKEAAQNSVPTFVLQSRDAAKITKQSLKLIKHEAEKQRRIKPPRELMESGALPAMMELKRCWLMSPLSVSQNLPNIQGLFDVVIFDEASQIRVEDAIPAIHRSKSVIVVGDSRQMPPTNFFGAATADEDEEDLDIDPPESLLAQACRSFESITLQGHYRSKDESLIAFSNYAFYQGGLIAAPNPQRFGTGDAVAFHSVADGYFRTKDGNPSEAKAVVAKVAQILKADPNASIGVISLGIAQQKAIETEIDLLVERDSAFAKVYTASLALQDEGTYVGFFNKNLENVQGDERDIILLSVGYAPAKPGAKLRRAFGPLSTKGGRRRLNVAASRARQRLDVFCSFDPHLIESDADAYEERPETTIFVRYLQYISHLGRGSSTAALALLKSMQSGAAFRQATGTSRLAHHIAERLLQYGYTADVEVGDCGFVVDLAVRDPKDEKSYLFAIEIDGGAHVSTAYSRDRDVARKALLESKGWTVLNVWSVDWTRNPEQTFKLLLTEMGKKGEQKAS